MPIAARGCSLRFFRGCFLCEPYRHPVPLLTHECFMLLLTSFSAPSHWGGLRQQLAGGLAAGWSQPGAFPQRCGCRCPLRPPGRPGCPG